MTKKLFSTELKQWLDSDKPKTLAGVNDVFAEKSFAVIFFILMSFPALPLPTGGLTHVFEIIVMLLALELIIGRRTIWLPKKWQHKSIGKAAEKKVMPFIYKRLKWFEKYSRPSKSNFLKDINVLRMAGLAVFIFSLMAFLAPPFTGLDTIPALGAVVISLALLFNDIRLFIIGNIAGILGVAVVIGLGKVIVNLVQKTF